MLLFGSEESLTTPEPVSGPTSGGDDLGWIVGLTIGAVILLAGGGVLLGVLLDQPSCDPVVGCIEF